jgi:hypothetical protein
LTIVADFLRKATLNLNFKGRKRHHQSRTRNRLAHAFNQATTRCQVASSHPQEKRLIRTTRINTLMMKPPIPVMRTEARRQPR